MSSAGKFACRDSIAAREVLVLWRGLEAVKQVPKERIATMEASSDPANRDVQAEVPEMGTHGLLRGAAREEETIYMPSNEQALLNHTG
jgi:hypothetical protein